jgi:hypothetical protein
VENMSSFFKKAYSFLKEVLNFLTLIKGLLPIPIIISIFVIIKKFLIKKQSIELPVYLWAILSSLFIYVIIFIIYYYIFKARKYYTRVINPKDIQHIIEDWFNHPLIEFPIETRRAYYYSDVDNELNLKLGSSRRYLPPIAMHHEYYLKHGENTFMFEHLNNLAKMNFKDYLEKYLFSKLRENKKETTLDCLEIAEGIKWPVEAIENFFQTTNKGQVEISNHKATIKSTEPTKNETNFNSKN